MMSSDFFLIVAQLEKYSIGMQRGGSNKNSQDILGSILPTTKKNQHIKSVHWIRS
jgi:hypothetical protein